MIGKYVLSEATGLVGSVVVEYGPREYPPDKPEDERVTDGVLVLEGGDAVLQCHCHEVPEVLHVFQKSLYSVLMQTVIAMVDRVGRRALLSNGVQPVDVRDVSLGALRRVAEAVEAGMALPSAGKEQEG